MLARKFRLRKEEDFQAVHRRGRFLKERFLAIRLLPNSLEISRFAFLVGLKASKKATLRNKIKRWVSEGVRLRWKGIKGGFDVVFMVRPDIVDKKREEIDEAVENILRRAGLLQ